MVTINLSQSGQQELARGGRGFIDGGVITSIVIIVLTLLALGGSKIYLSQLNGDIQKTDAEINAYLGVNTETGTQAVETDGVADSVADFKMRADAIISRERDHNSTDSLKEMAKLLVRGAFIESFEYEYNDAGGVKNVAAVINCDNFEVLSQQLLSLKTSKYFSGVSVTTESGVKNEDGKVALDVTMSIVEAKK